MRALTPRDVITELLTTLELAEHDWNPGSLGDGVRGMPSLYRQGSYAELERCLDEMRDDLAWRQPWWHVTHRYVFGLDVRIRVPYRRTLKGPMPNMPGRTELLFVEEILDSKTMVVRGYRWHERVEQQHVDAGLDRLLSTMYDGNTSRIHLPRELLYRALGKEPPDGKQLRASGLPSETLTAA